MQLCTGNFDVTGLKINSSNSLSNFNAYSITGTNNKLENGTINQAQTLLSSNDLCNVYFASSLVIDATATNCRLLNTTISTTITINGDDNDITHARGTDLTVNGDNNSVSNYRGSSLTNNGLNTVMAFNRITTLTDNQSSTSTKIGNY
jgi:hypothetical protein